MLKTTVPKQTLLNYFSFTFILLIVCQVTHAQQAPQKKHAISRIDLKKIERGLATDTALLRRYQDLTFYYKQNYAPKTSEVKKEVLKFEGYVDACYAYYSDSLALGQFQKFPTVSPRNQQFGLNMLYFSAKYESNVVRGTVGVHFGDIPQSSWSPVYNMIQEAHVGFRLLPGLWLDAGYFRTHLGFESIQPRENIGSSVSTTTYFEPYYFSGAKLTWDATDKIHLMAAAFNAFNNFLDNNRDLTYGFSSNFDLSKKVFVSYNVLYGNEMPLFSTPKMRLYNDLYAGIKSTRWDIGVEGNFGIQEKSMAPDSVKAATMMSGLLGIKYKLKSQKVAFYTRGEYFSDFDGILSGTFTNSANEQVGLDIVGLTSGIEFKPIPNSYLRFEHRALQTLQKNQDIFVSNQTYTQQRMEFTTCLGVWF